MTLTPPDTRYQHFVCDMRRLLAWSILYPTKGGVDSMVDVAEVLGY